MKLLKISRLSGLDTVRNKVFYCFAMFEVHLRAEYMSDVLCISRCDEDTKIILSSEFT